MHGPNLNFAGHLKKHIESIHEGVRYPCDQCDYRATEKGNLKRHEMFKHRWCAFILTISIVGSMNVQWQSELTQYVSLDHLQKEFYN